MNFYSSKKPLIKTHSNVAIHMFLIKTVEGMATTSTGQEEKEQNLISVLLHEAAMSSGHLPSLQWFHSIVPGICEEYTVPTLTNIV